MLLLSGKIIGKLFIILCKFLKSYNPLGLKSSPTDIALLQKELKRLKAANLIMKQYIKKQRFESLFPVLV